MIDPIMAIVEELETITVEAQESNEFVGDIMTDTHTPETTRLYFQNLNGLRWDNQGGKWPYVCEVISSIQVDIACFAETNTNTNNYTVRKSMETITQQHFSQSRLILASSKHSTTTMYKPGGTAILACNAITARIKTQTRDRMGRWTSISIETAGNRRLRIISAYQVCADIRSGSNTAASQQRAQIMEETSLGDNPRRLTPRQAFIQDLQSFIRQIQHEGEDIILVGDFNEEINFPASGMEQLATSCGL